MDTLFFIAAKLGGSLLRAEVWLLALCVGLGWTLWRGHLRAARRWFTALALLGGVLSFLPVGDMALRPLETRYPPAPPLTSVDGIIVLGGGGNAGATRRTGVLQVNEAGDRFIAGHALARRFPQAQVLFTGGNGQLRSLITPGQPEASLAERFFIEMGLLPERLLLENQSRNTAENARLSLPIGGPEPGDTWVLVTSAFHMPRALASFEAAGWPALVPYPVDHRVPALRTILRFDPVGQIGRLNLALKEWVGTLAYRLTDR